MDSKETTGEKSRRELHKDDASCFKLILGAAYKTAAVRPLTNHSSKTNS